MEKQRMIEGIVDFMVDYVVLHKNDSDDSLTGRRMIAAVKRMYPDSRLGDMAEAWNLINLNKEKYFA